MGGQSQRITVPGVAGAENARSTPSQQETPAADASDMMCSQEAPGAGNSAAQDQLALEGTGGGGKLEHYAVDIKAWIPHGEVVDPEEPLRASDWADTLTDVAGSVTDALTFGLAPTVEYEYQSRYHGDGHSDYGGTYRVLSRIEFDWDGTAISGLTATGTYGATVRNFEAKAWISSMLGNVNLMNNVGSESQTASSATSGSGSGRTFTMSIASANPLVMGPAPDINSNLTGTIGADGSLELAFDTDQFPSHGLEVSRNGAIVHTSVVNDASGVEALGVAGALNLGYGLSVQDNEGVVTLPAGTTGTAPLGAGEPPAGP